MKTPNTTDHIFREKLEDYASEVPVGLWEAIDTERSRKKRGFLFWQRKGKWMALLLLFVAVGAGYWLMADGTQLTAHDGIGEEKAIVNLNEETSGGGENGGIIHTEKNSEKNSNEWEEEKVAMTTSENSSQKKNNTLATEKTTNKNLIEKSENTPQRKQTPFVKSAIILNTNTPNTPVLETSKGLAKAFTNNSISTIDEPTPSDLFTPTSKVLNENNNLNALASLQLSELIFKGKPDPCYAFNPYDRGKKGPPRFYVDVLASPDFANRTLTAKNADLSGYATIRDSTETSRLGFSSTVRLSMVLANGIALRSGLAYAQINEQLDLFNGTHTEIQSYEVKDVHGNVVDIQFDTIVGRLIKTTYNRFKMIDVPVILGYEVRDRNWTFALNGGAFFNVLFEQKGEFLSPNLTPVTFTSTQEPHYNAYKKTVGMSLFGSVGVNYKISNRLHLMAEPHFRYYMDSFTNANYPLKQNYWAVGMNVGMRVQLF